MADIADIGAMDEQTWIEHTLSQLSLNGRRVPDISVESSSMIMDRNDPGYVATYCLVLIVPLPNDNDETKLSYLARALHAIKVGGLTGARSVSLAVVEMVVQQISNIVENASAMGKSRLVQERHHIC